MSAASKKAWSRRCVYCGVSPSRYACLQQDGPETWCCVDELACERRIQSKPVDGVVVPVLKRSCIHCGRIRTYKLQLTEDRLGYECVDAGACDARLRRQRSLGADLSAIAKRKKTSLNPTPAHAAAS